MSKRKNRDTIPNIGLSSLLIIFLVLCLTTFALLALSTAKSDYAFSQKQAKHRSDYYAASTKAEWILGEIDRMLETQDSELLSQKEFTINDSKITVSAEEGNTCLSYTIPIGNKQDLFVKLQLTTAATAEHYYEILAWQVNNH